MIGEHLSKLLFRKFVQIWVILSFLQISIDTTGINTKFELLLHIRHLIL